MKKKLAVLLLCVSTIVIIVLYSKTYSVSDNKKELEDNLKSFINRPTVEVNNVDIKRELNLDNKKYIVLLMDNDIGYSELTKGINNKYKIEYVGGEDGIFIENIYNEKENKQKYIIARGKNYDMKIAYMKMKVNNQEYKIHIPHEKYFLTYVKLQEKTDLVDFDIAGLRIFDKNDNDITDEVIEHVYR